MTQAPGQIAVAGWREENHVHLCHVRTPTHTTTARGDKIPWRGPDIRRYTWKAIPHRKTAHLSEPSAHPFHLTKLVTPALDGIVRAISDRGNQTEPQRLAKANDALILILSFLPCDAIDTMLAGQTVLFNEVLADSARDVLRGMADTMKPRALSGIISLGRLIHGHLDRLKARGVQPYRTEVASPQPEKREAPAAMPPNPKPPQPPRPAAPAQPTPPRTAPIPAATGTKPPTPVEAKRDATTAQTSPAETSWLDSPYEQWVIETPADLAARAARTPAQGNGAARIHAPPEAAIPPQRPVNAPASTFAATGD